jgi:DUF1365 family protein
MTTTTKSQVQDQVQLGFGHVWHKRLRPAVNAFRYGVYFLRVPLRATEQSVFLTRLCSRNRFNLLSFYDRDHGDGKQPLTQWIDGLLKQEGIHDADGEIWLQAFPRVLGYVFNPVSFWFCHRKDGGLRAVLCEVRNTFGACHHYLLDTGSSMEYGIELKAKKVFHVSPFCEIQGSYRFRFLLSTQQDDKSSLASTAARIDYDDDGGPLLLTSIAGKTVALSDRAVTRAFLAYPMMTFGVVAKIHWQALRLWLKRVPFFSNPDILPKQVTR